MLIFSSGVPDIYLQCKLSAARGEWREDDEEEEVVEDLHREKILNLSFSVLFRKIWPDALQAFKTTIHATAVLVPLSKPLNRSKVWQKKEQNLQQQEKATMHVRYSAWTLYFCWAKHKVIAMTFTL